MISYVVMKDWVKFLCFINSGKSALPRKFKAWIYQHGILPRLLWPLLIYEAPITTVEGLKRTTSQFLCSWLRLPKSLSSNAHYGHTNKLQLPFISLTEEFQVTKTWEVLLYRDSVDTRASSAGITVKTGWKWWAVEQGEARLRLRVLVGSVAVGRAGLGTGGWHFFKIPMGIPLDGSVWDWTGREWKVNRNDVNRPLFKYTNMHIVILFCFFF